MASGLLMDGGTEMLDVEMLILECVYFQVFLNSWKRWKTGNFEKPRLHFQIVLNSLKSLKIEIFVQLTSYFFKWWVRSFSTTCGVREEEPIYAKISSFEGKILLLKCM